MEKTVPKNWWQTGVANTCAFTQVIPKPQQVVRAQAAAGQDDTVPASSSLDLHSISPP